MTPDVCACPRQFYGGVSPLVLNLGASGGTTSLRVQTTWGTAYGAATATCDFLVRLLATCEKDDLFIEGSSSSTPAPLSGACISLFFQESRDDLRKIELRKMTLSEDHCLALATMSRLDVEVTIRNCNLADDAAAGAFVECLQSDRGPVELNQCEIDSQILASALAGKSRVTKLKLRYTRSTNEADMAVLVAALANNRGLVHLDLFDSYISDDNWSILCESMKVHPTLTSLDLRVARPRIPNGGIIALVDGKKSHRTRVLADTMKANTILGTLLVNDNEHDEQIYTEEIRPYLVTNLYRPRVLAIKKTKDRPFREKVLGRALYSVRSNPNLVWMLLSENVDAFVRSGEEEEESNSEVPVAVAAAVVVAAVGSKRKR
jgi:hypothetical protein